ncbi:MAG: DUF3261 domain-containing protein [Zoogloeaceae bacterium]|uniref:DUF3261 domain-containing protein n=1 Tax=Denitromonas sp. TaxID=2734609 RepID=UPI001DA97CFA|nr:DUF3261 domain-containing protein [Rhodocyclaceae bacterium]MCP5221714.1 DUF3261 domain-containing protein [Zoogloeaceae bacterium]HPR46303.1 DUF3261 domain-containing protein [Ottowia sp.]
MTAINRLALLGALALAGCASVPHEAGCTALAPTLRYCLQALPAGQTLAINQLVEFTLPDRPDGERLVFAIDAREARMQIVALTPLGQKLFRISAEHGTLHWDGPQAAEALGLRLPALIQLMLWPVDAVRDGLGQDAELSATEYGRTVHQGDAPPVLTTRQSDTDPTRGTIDAVFTPMDARIRVSRLEE